MDKIGMVGMEEGSGDLSKEEPKCKCNGCGREFPISKIEYGICPAENGCSVCYEASPCCHTGFQVL